MKKSKLSVKVILLVLILVVTNILLVTIKRKPRLIKTLDGTYTSKQINDYKWEYIKERLFSGKGETEFAYKIKGLDNNTRILIGLQDATEKDSIAVNEIINELRTIIPNKTIDYFKNFTGISYKDFSLLDTYDHHKVIKGVSHHNLRLSTIHLSFGKENDATLFEDVIKTVLTDGSAIERTNPQSEESSPRRPSRVWFHLKKTLPITKKKRYIKYEVLRTLCFLYPDNSHSRAVISKKGVFFTPNYIPELAKLNEKDKFLLQKLYEDDFIEQFKSYLYAHYSWRYAINFINKDFSKLIAWGIIISIGLLALVLLFSFFQKKIFKYVYLDYFLPIYFVMLYYITLMYTYIFITDIKENITELHILIGFLTASIMALLISFSLWIVDRFLTNKISNLSFQLIIKVIFTFLIFNIPVITMLMIKGSADTGSLMFYLPTVLFTLVLAIGRGVLIYLNNVSESIVRQKDVELSKMKQLHAQAETRLLQSQINPHFLYNSLNSIASLAPIDSEKTQKMAHSLSDLFKYSINRKGKKMSTVKDEIDMVKSYLEIEKIRFGDRLQFDIDADNAIKNYEIPLFLIQPLVENAVKHGISQNEGEGKIVLKIETKNNELVISVSDNGPNFPEGLVSGHGLQTVYDLLRLSYGDSASLYWTNTPEKIITIIIPDTV